MAFFSVVRRRALREHLSIPEIARATKLSRNTIPKYLRDGRAEPEFKVAERPSKLDPSAPRLSGRLQTLAGKPRNHRRTSRPLQDDLVKPG